jgi:hypothetical protein
MSYNYTSPGWTNGGLPAINATNLNAMSNLLAAMGSAFDNGGDPANLWGGSGAYNTSSTLSGAAGVLPVTSFSYNLGCASGCTSATIPPGTINGQTITIKNYALQTVTIFFSSANLGVYAGSNFYLYAPSDYVTFSWDSTMGKWYVISTNGPILSSIQTGGVTTSAVGIWTAIGAGLSLGTIIPGMYDFDLDLGIGTITSSHVAISIGSGTTPISNPKYLSVGTSVTGVLGPINASVHGYLVVSGAIIQGLYQSDSTYNAIAYSSTIAIGKITARRIA